MGAFSAGFSMFVGFLLFAGGAIAAVLGILSLNMADPGPPLLVAIVGLLLAAGGVSNYRAGMRAVLSEGQPKKKPCPACKEPVHAEATRCPHCTEVIR